MGDVRPDRERVRARIVQLRLSRPGTAIEDAVSRCRTYCSGQEHVFWPDSVSLCDRGRFRWNHVHVQGHRQITDAYLLALAIANQGRLATFDSTISLRAVEGAKGKNLERIAA